MIIPQYWAEARLRHRDRKRQVTVRRFGWSDDSLEAAQAHAETRVREAFEHVLAGEHLPRRERRVAYGGADGVPIREEIVQREGEAVISRNAYGALCLNTPNVFFADIDFETAPSFRMSLATWLGLWAAAALVSRFAAGVGTPESVLAGFGIALFFGAALARQLKRAHLAAQGGPERVARRRIEAFVAEHSQWRLRLYRTPAGLRLLAVHRVFDPREPEVAAAFKDLGADTVYAAMCHNQNCFRARVSPKPWRIGLQRMRPPYSAAWRPEHAELPARQAWIRQYEEAGVDFAACRYLETLGRGPIDAVAESVQQLHDRLCKAERDLPLA